MNSFTAVFSVTLSFRNHYNMLLFCPRNSSYYYQCFMRLNILMETDNNFFTDSFINRKFERTAFLLCDIVNVFVGMFNQFNEYLGNKSSNIFQKQTKKRTDPKILKGSVILQKSCQLKDSPEFPKHWLYSNIASFGHFSWYIRHVDGCIYNMTDVCHNSPKLRQPKPVLICCAIQLELKLFLLWFWNSSLCTRKEK